MSFLFHEKSNIFNFNKICKNINIYNIQLSRLIFYVKINLFENINIINILYCTILIKALFSSSQKQKVFKILRHIESCGTCMKH